MNSRTAAPAPAPANRFDACSDDLQLAQYRDLRKAAQDPAGNWPKWSTPDRWGEVELGLVAERKITAKGRAYVAAAELKAKIGFCMPYDCRPHSLAGKEREAAIAELLANFSIGELSDWAEDQRARTEAGRRRDSADYAGIDLLDARRGTYKAFARIALVREAIEAGAPKVPKHAQFCRDFLGI